MQQPQLASRARPKYFDREIISVKQQPGRIPRQAAASGESPGWVRQQMSVVSLLKIAVKTHN